VVAIQVRNVARSNVSESHSSSRKFSQSSDRTKDKFNSIGVIVQEITDGMKISMTSKDVLHPDECDVRVNYEPVTSVHSDAKSTHNFKWLFVAVLKS
jgi:hypothetical protein